MLRLALWSASSSYVEDDVYDASGGSSGSPVVCSSYKSLAGASAGDSAVSGVYASGAVPKCGSG